MAITASNVHRIGISLMARELEQECKKSRKFLKERRKPIKRDSIKYAKDTLGKVIGIAEAENNPVSL